MDYIHVKNLGKYQPGYTDRKHIWAKIYYETFLDEAVQGLCEIDRYRFWSLIVFEVYTQKPIPLTDTNLKIMGWNRKKRHISLSLQMLHTLIEVRNIESSPPLRRVEESRGEESRGEENRVDKNTTVVFAKWNSYKKTKGWKSHNNPSYETTSAITEQQKHYSTEDLCAAINNYASILYSVDHCVFNVGERHWDKFWTLREFLLRGTKADHKEKYLYRFLPSVFSPSDFLTQAARKKWQGKKTVEQEGKERKEDRREYSKFYKEKSTEELKKYRKSDTCRGHWWLIDEILKERGRCKF